MKRKGFQQVEIRGQPHLSLCLLPRRTESDSAFSSLIPGLIPCPHPTALTDMPQLTGRLSRLEGAYIRQTTEAARINNRAENARLHYSEVSADLFTGA